MPADLVLFGLQTELASPQAQRSCILSLLYRIIPCLPAHLHDDKYFWHAVAIALLYHCIHG